MMLFSIWGRLDSGSVPPSAKSWLYTQTGMMICAFIFAALVASKLIRPWQILILAGLGRDWPMAFDMPARQAFMVEMTSRETDERGFTQQLDRQWGRVVGSLRRRPPDGQSRDGNVLFSEWAEFHRGDRQFANDASFRSMCRTRMRARALPRAGRV